jgi:hypothetical protein
MTVRQQHTMTTERHNAPSPDEQGNYGIANQEMGGAIQESF